MRNSLLILLIAVLTVSVGWGFGKQKQIPKVDERSYRVYCDENFFVSDNESLLYPAGSTVLLDFLSAFDDVHYSFIVEGVEDFEVHDESGKGYVIEFVMPENYVVVRYQVDEPFSGIAITMDENPTTGFEWIVTVSQQDVLELVEDRYVSDESDEPVDGLGGVHYWKYKVVGSGSVELCFKEMRGDEWITPGILYRYSCDGSQAALLETVYFEEEAQESSAEEL